MSLAPSKPSPSPEPVFDLTYSVEDFQVSPHRDHRFLVARMEEALLAEAGSTRDALDIACGVGSFTAALAAQGTRAYGLDPSAEMLGIGVLIDAGRRRRVLRGVAEHLPVRSDSFDLIVCEGALDHFIDPGAFMSEAARVLRNDGRLVVALANYDSLSCRIGRLIARGRRARSNGRPYWSPPEDHYHRGNLAFVRGLAGALRLERCTGISLLWLLPGWGRLLDRLPPERANAILRRLDRLAGPNPAIADVIISTWAKKRS